ncbi:tetratricopeptide repeat protein [Micromonospora sp. CA-240977]|uniref:tetratricopeptide repeat protein n=1 Tax=Micromonospora sp. CA-240977 TaxID=3239957 RepID=UPI003D8DAACE
MSEKPLDRAVPLQPGPVDAAVTVPGRTDDPLRRDDDLPRRVDELRRSGRTSEALRLLEAAPTGTAEPPAALAVARARVLLAVHRSDDAAEVLRQAHERHGASAELSAWLVASLSRGRHYDDAATVAAEAGAAFPASPLLRVATGRLLVDQYRFEESLPYFREAHALDRDDPRGLRWLLHGLRCVRRFDDIDTLVATAGMIADTVRAEYARSLLDRYRFEEVIAYLDTAQDEEPPALLLRLEALSALGRVEEAQRLAEAALARKPEEPRRWVGLAHVLDESYRFEESLASFEQALTIDPFDADALEWRTTELRNLRRWADAERSALEAVTRAPRLPQMQVELGCVYEDQHDFERARAAFGKALDIDPGHEWALSSHVSLLRRLHRLDEAEEAARQAIERRPDSPDLYRHLAYVHDDRHDHESALAAADRALAIDPGDGLALAWRIRKLRHRRCFDEAEAAIRQATEKRPDLAQPYVELGYLHDDRYDHERALEAFEQALTIDPHHEWALAWRITELRQLRRFDDAEQAARQAVEARPDSPQLHLELGYLHDDRHDHRRALEAFEQALTIDPHHESALAWRITELRQLRRLDDAEEAAREAIENRPDSPNLRLQLAYVHDDKHDYEQALTAVEQALTLDPHHEWALVWRITELRQLRRFDDAEQSARQAIEARPNSPQLHLELGHLHDDRHDHKRALDAFEQALTIDPHHESALAWRIIQLRQLRRFDDAEQAARQAIEARPDSPDLRLQLAYVHDDRNDHAHALTAVVQALTLDPHHESALTWHITELRRLRRFDEAEEAVRRAVEARPDSPRPYVELGYLHDDRYDHRRALEAFEQALSIDPQHESALIWHIVELRRLRRFKEAEDAIRLAIGKRPDSPDLHLQRALLHENRHDHEQALTAVEQALTISPQHELALAWRVTELRQLRRFDEAEEAVRRAVEARPDSPRPYVELGYLHDDRHDHRRALEAFEQALTIDPHHESALIWHIVELRRLRRLDEAEEAARQAIETLPGSPDPHLQLAYVHDDRHDSEQALTAVEQALTIDPHHEWALARRIIQLRQLRRLDQAEEAARLAIDARPDSLVLHLELASVSEDRGDFEAAGASVQAALDLDPRDDLALAARIRVLRLSRDFVGALTAAQRAVVAHPDSVEVLLELGNAHADRYDDQQALAAFDSAFAIDPGRVHVVERRVVTLQRLQRHVDAERCARAAVALRPESESLHICLGQTFEERLQVREALACYEAAALCNPHNPRALVGRSAALRTLHSYAEADGLISPLAQEKPHLRALTEELAWIQHDSERLSEARATFTRLERTALSNGERAASIAGLGWVDFTCGDYVSAEDHFRRSVELMPHDREYRLARAWALVRQDERRQWEEAEQLCLAALAEHQDAAVLVCLGVIDYRLGRLPAAEYHLGKALKVDPYKGSHTDLASLYTQLGRYEEAEAHLNVAIAQDPYAASAQVELGHLRLLMDQPQEATRLFRGVLRVDPSVQVAALGLAEALTALGRSREAEDVLREGLRTAAVPWRLHLALARLLFHQADATQNDDVFAEAYAEAVEAIAAAPAGEADPYYVAAVCQVRLGGTATVGALGDAPSRRVALRHLRRCLSVEREHVDAQRLVQLLERERGVARTAALGTATIATVALGLLAVMWTAFFVSDRVTTVMITTITPVLVGLVAVAVLLPSLIRLKLPGFEADLQAGLGQITAGPTGEVVIRPGNLAISTGPVGYAPNQRRSEDHRRR